jgi:energy-converting hydrogenase Eha subunit E
MQRLEVSGAERFIYKSLGVEGLTIGVVFSVFLGYDEHLQDLVVRLQCGQ